MLYLVDSSFLTDCFFLWFTCLPFGAALKGKWKKKSYLFIAHCHGCTSQRVFKINAILLSLPPWSFGRKRLFISVGFIQSDIHPSYAFLLCKSKTLLLVKRLCSPWGVKWVWVEFLTPGPFVMPTPKWLIDWLVACSAGVLSVMKKLNFKVVNSQHSYIM